MTGRNIVKEMEMIDALLSDEMKQMDAMYESYSDGYNQRLADTNNRLYGSFVRLQFKGDVSFEVGRILIDTGLAKTVSRTYYCASAKFFAVWAVQWKSLNRNALVGLQSM